MRLFIAFTVFIFIMGCNKNTKSSDSTNEIISEEVFLEEFEKETVIGLVEVYPGENEENVYLVKDWESRSRISLLVDETMADEVAEYKGKIIKVNGKVTMSGTWSGEIVISTIVGEVSDKTKK